MSRYLNDWDPSSVSEPMLPCLPKKMWHSKYLLSNIFLNSCLWRPPFQPFRYPFPAESPAFSGKALTLIPHSIQTLCLAICFRPFRLFGALIASACFIAPVRGGAEKSTRLYGGLGGREARREKSGTKTGRTATQRVRLLSVWVRDAWADQHCLRLSVAAGLSAKALYG
ncbi:hypothetical protein GS393_02222 [Pseudomonas savastanoi pv. phaseolicola]|nr:hypothetical protein [Pseudomonas savastanoi pv. phaseolicola]